MVGPATREVLTPTWSLLASVLSCAECLFTSFGGYSRGKLLEGYLLLVGCRRLDSENRTETHNTGDIPLGTDPQTLT